MKTAIRAQFRKREDQCMQYDREEREIAFSIRYSCKEENNPESILKEKIVQEIHQKMIEFLEYLPVKE